MHDTVTPKAMTYKIVAEFPHDQDAFTQGLEHGVACEDASGTSGGPNECLDVFWESTGMHGHSTVRRVRVSDGAVLSSHPLTKEHFGEGLTKMGGKLYQLTWTRPDGFIYDAERMEQVGTFKTELNDGWGLANDGKLLLATDSGHKLYWLDPQQQFKTVKTIEVKSAGVDVHWLNELEVVDGDLFANVWQTECIARIDLVSGSVTHWYLMHGLRGALAARPSTKPRLDVLNGIAWDAIKKRLFVTGKYWPAIFEVELVDFAPGMEPSYDEVAQKCLAPNQRGARRAIVQHASRMPRRTAALQSP